MKSMRNPAEMVVLGRLRSGPAHGYDLARAIGRDVGGVWRLGQSQVYALLARLERDGLVGHSRQEQDGRPARKVYAITPAGRRAFGSWVKRPVPGVRDIRLELLTKLHFCDPDAGRRLVLDQIAVLKRSAVSMRRRRARGIEARAVSFRLAMIEAAIGWLEGL